MVHWDRVTHHKNDNFSILTVVKNEKRTRILTFMKDFDTSVKANNVWMSLAANSVQSVWSIWWLFSRTEPHNAELSQSGMNTDVFETVPQNASLLQTCLRDVAKIDYKSMTLLFRSRSDAVDWGGALKPEGLGVDSRCVHWDFFIDLILLAAL
jgi:hypothetical protein